MESRVHTIHSGKWIHYRVAEFTDPGGTNRRWEYVDRTDDRIAVIIVPVCRPSNDLIFARQYRPAMGRDVIEFPAGLVDEGESFAETAIRELREETGYSGQVIWESPVLCSSPGVTSERTCLVGVEVDDKMPANRAPEAACEEDEWIEVVRIKHENAAARLLELSKDNVIIDSRIWAWLAGSGVNNRR